jgi:predicted CXXCH cytochrome family protein
MGAGAWCAAACAGVLLLSPWLALSDEAPESIDPAASCVTSECHGEVADHPRVHWSGFEKAGECQKCHDPDGDRHEFSLDDSAESCFQCHEDLAKAVASAETVHDALEDGCLDCHHPHGGEDAMLMRGVVDEDLRPVCFECHDEDILQKAVTHGPADAGACNQCHDPHASSNPNLLLAQGLELCGECHEEIAEDIEGAQFIHDPAEEDCVNCHNPHSGPYDGMLFAEGRKLCGECHDDVVEEAEQASVDHQPALNDDECISCHSPHAANSEPNLKAPQIDLCLSCHDEPLKSGNSVLKDMKAWLDANPLWHKPIEEDHCSGCHRPHGGNNSRLLADPFPTTFYTSFEIGKYALCFSCHEETLATKERTRALTGFRDGDRNLHFLHVNKKKRGRTCRACHDMHASSGPRQIRDAVPYGKWMMPLHFEKGENGGSCQPGCHESASYDRERPGEGEKE